MEYLAIIYYFKLAGALISPLIYLLRFSRQFQSIWKRRAKELESLEFISAFLAFDVARRNRLVVEHAFEIYLRKRVSYEEIQALLQLANPLMAARMFLKVRQYVCFNSTIEQFEYHAFVDSDQKRIFHKILNMLGYFFFSIVGVLLFLYAPEIIGYNNPTVVFPLAFVVIAFLFLSYLFLENGVAISMAGKFLKEAENCAAK